ncbi:hypothetical protein JX265_013888 [Neoarthrinium moseri]|uniref:Uncharacterized protein n=1 Tax=Neoarthrinium moseri TaxID=1658444 RepID=A0A9Q0AH97_9PEZI|nr:hypothetical protein JX265_013888 [Neoarthrinium moseri]
MRFIIGLSAVFTIAFGGIIPLRRDFSDHLSLGNISWAGILEEGGPRVEVTGSSFEDIERQIQSTKPDFTWDSIKPFNPPAAGQGNTDTYVNCNEGSGQTSVGRIGEGIAYLRSKPGDCRAAARPAEQLRSCGRVSCSYNAAIQLCSTATNDIWMPCATIGDYAQIILNHCTQPGIIASDALVQGTKHDPTGMFVEVGDDSC